MSIRSREPRPIVGRALLEGRPTGIGKTMRFLCLGYLDMDDFDRIPEAEKDDVLKACFAQLAPFHATGKVVVEEGLEHYRRAKSIRPRGGRPTVTDGPFIETKEQIGSVFVVEADDLDEAVRVASLHPAAQMGERYGFGIEVRPIR